MTAAVPRHPLQLAVKARDRAAIEAAFVPEAVLHYPFSLQSFAACDAAPDDRAGAGILEFLLTFRRFAGVAALVAAVGSKLAAAGLR